MKEYIKTHLPCSVVSFIQYLIRNFVKFCEYISVLCQPIRFKKSLIKLRDKQVYNVAFFVVHSSVWKYDFLYQLMQQHKKFKPLIVICPVVNYGKENMQMEIERNIQYFEQKGYDMICAYDIKTGRYLDIKKEVEIDIIFYTNPYKYLIDRRYYIDKFLDKFTCYVPYSASVCCDSSQFRLSFYSMLSKFYLENTLSQQIAKREMLNKARNTKVVGFPVLDAIFDNSVRRDVWKHPQKFKIIWAPHHSFDAGCSIHFSSFLQVSDCMLKIRNRYKKDIQIAFKPHPLLYIKLLNLWGKGKTDEYYQAWADGENSQYEDSEYVDLFRTSDAMIFDSVSFIYEYLYTQKPSLFIYSNSIDEQLNDFGKAALQCHQFAVSVSDIEKFILQVINQAQDPLQEKKKAFFQNNIVPPNAKTASENILMDLLSVLS